MHRALHSMGGRERRAGGRQGHSQTCIHLGRACMRWGLPSSHAACMRVCVCVCVYAAGAFVFNDMLHAWRVLCWRMNCSMQVQNCVGRVLQGGEVGTMYVIATSGTKDQLKLTKRQLVAEWGQEAAQALIDAYQVQQRQGGMHARLHTQSMHACSYSCFSSEPGKRTALVLHPLNIVS